jgi:hypothetical protein
MKIARLFCLLVLLATAPSFADALYDVSIDTSSLTPGTTGFIDFGFNGGFTATVAIENFSNPGGTLDSTTLSTSGTVSGTLPGTVTMGNDNADYDEGIKFGTPIHFLLDFSGTPSGSTGDAFTLSFFNSDFSGALLTGNLNDLWLAQFQLDTHGGITATAYANPAGGPSFADIQPVPEPAGGSFLILGLLGACMLGGALRVRG